MLCGGFSNKIFIYTLVKSSMPHLSQTELGQYLALDLGGTNFRVLLITLHKDKKPDILSEIYFVPEEIMTGPGVDVS